MLSLYPRLHIVKVEAADGARAPFGPGVESFAGGHRIARRDNRAMQAKAAALPCRPQWYGDTDSLNATACNRRPSLSGDRRRRRDPGAGPASRLFQGGMVMHTGRWWMGASLGMALLLASYGLRA